MSRDHIGGVAHLDGGHRRGQAPVGQDPDFTLGRDAEHPAFPPLRHQQIALLIKIQPGHHRQPGEEHLRLFIRAEAQDFAAVVGGHVQPVLAVHGQAGGGRDALDIGA